MLRQLTSQPLWRKQFRRIDKPKNPSNNLCQAASLHAQGDGTVFMRSHPLVFAPVAFRNTGGRNGKKIDPYGIWVTFHQAERAFVFFLHIGDVRGTPACHKGFLV